MYKDKWRDIGETLYISGLYSLNVKLYNQTYYYTTFVKGSKVHLPVSCVYVI